MIAQHRPKLQPWITVAPKLKGLPGYISYNKLSSVTQTCSLISILAIQCDHLELISEFQIPVQSETKTVVYISEIIPYNNKNIRFVYVPPNKNDHQSVQYFSDLFRELSEVVLSDINNIGLNKVKTREGNNNKKYVLVNGRDIYRAEYGQNQIELVKKIQTSFFQAAHEHINSFQQLRTINLECINASVVRFSKYWQLLVGAEKSWIQLGISTIQYYRAQTWLTQNCDKWSQMKKKNRMLSNIQLQLIHQEILSNCSGQSSLQMATLRDIAHDIIEDIKMENSTKVIDFILDMQESIKNQYIQSPRQISKMQEQITDSLKLYGIPQECVDFMTYPLQRMQRQEEIDNFRQQIQKLNVRIKDYELLINKKNSQINDFKHELEEYSCKFVHLLQIEKKCHQIVQKLDSLHKQNNDLTSQLQKQLSLEKRYQTIKAELQEKVYNQDRENKGMLQCLKELTQQSLSLHTKIDQQRSQITELKEQLQNNTMIQVRALRSIQNQAQIKNRLQRYENYVSQLKFSFKSFKKLQSQKFNYILSQNYKQYIAIKDQLKKITLELKQEKLLNQQLSQCLQREKARMGYFQKFLRSNYQNEPIPQCSEENSATDREQSSIE